MRPQAEIPKNIEPKDSLREAATVARYLPTDGFKTYPDLADVVAPWPHLPEAI
jgi:hypothetical protein